MEHKPCSSQVKAIVTALRERMQGYCGRDSDLVQDRRTRNTVNSLQARLMAFDLERRMRYESCTADVLTKEEAKDFRSDVADAERYGIAWSEDQLDEVDIRELAETPRTTFISHNLAPE
ncbi:hypothetical protein Droror1_Dr00000636, partial [Drosera rotundifolia]